MNRARCNHVPDRVEVERDVGWSDALVANEPDDAAGRVGEGHVGGWFLPNASVMVPSRHGQMLRGQEVVADPTAPRAAAMTSNAIESSAVHQRPYPKNVS